MRALVLNCVGAGRLAFFLAADEEGFETRDLEARVDEEEEEGFLEEDLLEGLEGLEEEEPLVGAMVTGDYVGSIYRRG